MENEITDSNTFYWQVAGLAVENGYGINQVRMFYNDILDFYHEGKSVEECVGEVF